MAKPFTRAGVPVAVPSLEAQRCGWSCPLTYCKHLLASSQTISISTSPVKPTGKVWVEPKTPLNFKSKRHLIFSQGLRVELVVSPEIVEIARLLNP